MAAASDDAGSDRRRLWAGARWLAVCLVVAPPLWLMAWVGFQFETHVAFLILLALLLFVTDREPGDGWMLAGAAALVGGWWAFYVLI